MGNDMAKRRPEDLPDFENPPVVETVLSVQFETLIQMRAAHLGLIWQEFRDRFRRTEERPPLEPVFEKSPQQNKPRLGVQLQALENIPVPRCWFLNQEGTELMQVQPDRFIKNWRKVGEGDLYPRYEKVRAAFEADFARFRALLAAQELGSPRVNQCEVTYVNHIVAGEGWENYSEVDKVFRVWQQPPEHSLPGRAEDVTWHARFPITGTDGKLLGRLHAVVQPAVRITDDRPMFVFNLTARGQVGDSLDFFDLGREWVVRSFAEMTTEKMHRIWRRRQHASNG
jgi:uncharacterized protein (TIGR04255 family)